MTGGGVLSSSESVAGVGTRGGSWKSSGRSLFGDLKTSLSPYSRSRMGMGVGRGEELEALVEPIDDVGVDAFVVLVSMTMRPSLSMTKR